LNEHVGDRGCRMATLCSRSGTGKRGWSIR
jgi:hypothetical protein